MPLGMEVGLGPGHIVLYGDPASPREKGHSPLPIFGACLLWPNGLSSFSSLFCLHVYSFVRYIELSLLSPRIVLIFLRTRVALRGQKGPHVLT